MGEFFGSIYTALFEGLFGINLADYLWGVTSQDGANLYIGIGLWMFGVSLLVAVLFYYIINHPRLNTWWGWGIFMIINAMVNFCLGIWWTLSDLWAGDMEVYDKETRQMVTFVTEGDCLSFGIANTILSLFAFFIISMAIKWKSTNASQAPFNK